MSLNTTRKKILLLLAAFFVVYGIATSIVFPKNSSNIVPRASISPSPFPLSPSPSEITPTSTRSSAVQHTSREVVTVTKVVDGDTIEVTGGRKLRYIGINTPETVDPRRSVQCYGKEASNRNIELVLGKQVELEKDISETDRFGRLLRYVYLGDTMINEQLVEEGYAYASSYPPDVKYQDRFNGAQARARAENNGLWASCQGTAPTPKLQQIPSNASTAIPAQGASGFVCDCRKACSQITSCDEAYYQLNTCGCKTRDSDGDGVPCESVCR